MKLRTLVVAAMFAIAGSAFANHCPLDMKKIDEALAKKPNISAEKLADVKKLRAEGEALHKAGKHKESIETLGKAMEILGINN
ncbi:MAG: hypothetical protein HY067_22535 [Betaproteobacteria bacterium]|nr:hypothetical protein [Betaproteobacteria bacterium]